MNERIQELAEQAGFQYIKDEGIGWAGNYNSSLPKFAELIIQECLLALEPDLYESDIEYKVDQAFYKKCERIIKKHFGVEEK
jgi:hypothetical protein